MKKSAKRKQIARQRATQKRQRQQKHHRHAVAADRGASRRPAIQEPLLSGDLREGERALLEHFDGYAALRNALKDVAERDQEWAGIPMPIEGCGLVIEPSFPRADALMAICRPPGEEAEKEGNDEGIVFRNQFWSWAEHADVIVFEDNGKIQHVLSRKKIHNLDLTLGVLSCSDAWGIEQEQKAVKLLGTMVRHRQLKQYLLTGMFCERSRRSGIHYLFRRLRPTVAFTQHGSIRYREIGSSGVKIIAALCLHPIGYYTNSWGGAMCPTDDVVAHLALMRGDEHMFWRRANQHPPYRNEAGL